MKAELVSIKTADGVVLHGALYEGQKDYPAVILLPGAAMNFYSGLGSFLPPHLAGKGFTCLSVNHRGHDIGTAPDLVNPRVIGSVFDCLEYCIYDIRAIIEYLMDQGMSEIILAGHSQAAIKLLYALKEMDLPCVKGVIMISPPPSAPEMMKFLLGSKYPSSTEQMRQLSSENEHDQVLVFKGRGNLPYFFSVRTYLNLYSPESLANTMDLIKEVSCPMLIIRGEYDLPPVTTQLIELLRAESRNPDQCRTIDLQGANHFYTGQEELLGEVIIEWLREIALISG